MTTTPSPTEAPEPTYPVRCPTQEFEDGITGCGSTNVAGPDSEGLYDCRGCGLWFREPTEDER